MDDFETINLDNKECKICKQETGEELISCILREKFYSTEDVSPNSSDEVETSFAHRVCLERWDAVMKNTFFPQQKKTWKDRIKGFISTGSSNNNAIETWTPVVLSNVERSAANDDPIRFASKKREQERSSGTSGHSMFSESKEVYRVENVGKRESEYGQWRSNKIRICSIDSDDEDDKPARPLQLPRQKYVGHTREKCKSCMISK